MKNEKANEEIKKDVTDVFDLVLLTILNMEKYSNWYLDFSVSKHVTFKMPNLWWLTMQKMVNFGSSQPLDRSTSLKEKEASPFHIAKDSNMSMMFYMFLELQRICFD